jgi:hypothetical protein
MKTGTQNQEGFNTCLENPEFAEAMRVGMDRLFTGPSADTCMNGKRAATDAVETGDDTIGIVRSVMKLHPCSTCAIRRKAAAKPRSFFARMHRWHMTWWPGWKIHQAELHKRSA